jgi:hypothetical protein
MSGEKQRCDEKLTELFETAGNADETRLQGMFPGQKPAGFYREQDMRFFAYFLERELRVLRARTLYRFRRSQLFRFCWQFSRTHPHEN